MIPALFTILKNNSGVTNLLGTNPLKVYPWNEVPQNTLYPYVTYFVASGIPENQMDKAPDVDNLGTQVDVWASTGQSCVQVATAVRDALEAANHMTRLGAMQRDPQTKAYRLQMDFDMFTFR